jgi:hypothetical protein
MAADILKGLHEHMCRPEPDWSTLHLPVWLAPVDGGLWGQAIALVTWVADLRVWAADLANWRALSDALSAYVQAHHGRVVVMYAGLYILYVGVPRPRTPDAPVQSDLPLSMRRPRWRRCQAAEPGHPGLVVAQPVGRCHLWLLPGHAARVHRTVAPASSVPTQVG